mgnify:CR=1 FL=1
MAINYAINYIYSIYMADTKAFKKKSLNWQDYFNEVIISATLYWKFLFCKKEIKIRI